MRYSLHASALACLSCVLLAPVASAQELQGEEILAVPVLVSPTPVCGPYQDCNGPLLIGDPLLERPGDQPGWLGSVELSILGAHIKNRLVTVLQLQGFFPNTVHLPSAELCAAISPRFELGYRLPEGKGEFLVAYRSLVTEGTGSIAGFDLDGREGYLRSRLNLNVVDLDYASREFALDPNWDMKWKVGARIASIYFDSQAYGAILEQKTSNNFTGAGPLLGLDLRRRLPWRGLELFGRLEGAAVFGEIRQSFGESVLFRDGSIVGAAAAYRTMQTSPVLDFQVGVGCPLPRWDHCRFLAGYQFEQWWTLGQLDDSRAELTAQGAFFRLEINY